MSKPAEKGAGGLPRPYTTNTFRQKLEQFEELIARLTQQDSEASAEERRQAINENLRFDTFCDSIQTLFGPDIRSTDLKSIFRKISTNPDAKVDWSELFGYFQSTAEETEQTHEDISVFTVSKKQRIGEAAGDRKRRDVIHSTTNVPQVDVYLAASQKGVISVWNCKTLRLQACCDVNETCWVTGVDYLPSLRRVACCTERSICVWDHRAKGKNQSIFCIKPTDNSVQCLAYVPHTKNLHEDCLLFGDDQGCISLLTIAAKDLNTKHAKLDKRNQNLIIEPATLTYPIVKRKFHDNWVLKIKYFPELRCFASCSPSSTTSFVLESVDRIVDNQPCKSISIPKGVNSFAFCSRANVIATGGNDKLVRIWHPHIFSRPTGKMIGHLFTIIDVAVNEKDQHVISLSTARVFRIWDIHTLTSLQVFTDNEDRPGEKRIHCMVFDEKHERLVTGSSVLDAWPLTRTVQDTMQVPHTHDRPISHVLCNDELNQVVSVCTESVIKVWELESGKAVYHVTGSHGPNTEVTALAIDSTGYRLASGAVDGSIKVWDFGSGQEIRSWIHWGDSEREEDISITALLYCNVEKFDDPKLHRCIAALGWNNKLKLLEDPADHGDLILFAEFSGYTEIPQSLLYQRTNSPTASTGSSSARGGSISPFNKAVPLPGIGKSLNQVTQAGKEVDILQHYEMTCMTFLEPDLLATGCTNGNIILWDVTKGTIENIFEMPLMPPTNDEETRLKTPNPHKIYMMKFLIHRTRRLDPAYIKTLTGRRPGTSSSPPDGGDRGLSELREDDEDLEDLPPASRREQRMKDVEEEEEMEVEKRLEDEEGKTPRPRDDDVVGDEDAPAPQDREGKEAEEERGMEGDEEKGDGDEEEGGGRSPQRTGGTKPGTVDPNAKMLVTEYEPVLVSVHADSFIRFWTMEGEVARMLSAVTKRQGSPVTSLCSDEDCNLLITGDMKGYITMWNIAVLLEDPLNAEQGAVQQLISWRGHLSKIVSLIYIDRMKIIISGSTDGSVRVWYADAPQRSHFMGFFGQHRPWNYPSAESSSEPVLPYDIAERPLLPPRRESEKKKQNTQSYEYPLIFDNDKWKPFRRSAYQETRTKKMEPEEKKFFEALQKPHFYNNHLTSFKTGEMSLGAVFRALPVYRVKTPERLKTPPMEYSNSAMADNSYLFGPAPKSNRVPSPTKEVSTKQGKGQKRGAVSPMSRSPAPSPRRHQPDKLAK
ncbi:WD repeat-containing protein 64-like [Diadema antillarum]|uniref:WD repeat-containing protein 64-like n=1 Tax=Diadema antillarum TaxID=105358 RepID=UPI003A8695D3